MSFILEPDSEPELVRKNIGRRLNTEGKINLPYHESKFHVITKSSSAESSFFAKLLGLSLESSYAGVIHEVARFNKVTLDDGKRVNVGVGVRMYAIAKSIDISFNLTIPNLAAAGQLGNGEVYVATTAIGYNASLGDLAASPSRLDVETFVDITESFSNMQKLVFAETAEKYYVPKPIEYID